MRNRLLLILVMALLAGCSLLPSSATETPTPVPPTETPIPPTATPTLVPITDADFAEAAGSVCETLKADIEEIKDSQRTFIEEYALHGEALQKVVDALQDLALTEANAPQASVFMSSLTEMAQVLSTFADALEVGMNNKGLTPADVSYIAIAEDDRVFVFTDVWVDLEIDPELVARIVPLKEALNTAADKLGLDACKIE